jgi:hypothetical protein
MYSFPTPPKQLKPGQQIGEGLLIANHLDQSLWCANQKHWVAVRSYSLHFFFRCKALLNHLPATGNLHHNAVTKPFSWAKPHVLDFLHLIYYAESHTGHCWRWSYKFWGVREFGSPLLVNGAWMNFFWLQQIMGTFHGSISLNCHSFMMRWYFTWSQSHMYIVSAMHVQLHAMHISLHSLNAKWFHFKYVYVKFGWNENQRNLNMKMELFFPCVLLPWSFCFFKFLK